MALSKPAPPRAAGKQKKADVRFKLTKAQKAYVEQLVTLDNRIAVCREYIALWMNFFRFFAEDMTRKEITAAEEKQFFQVMTALTRKHFTFVELMAETFDRGNDIIAVLSTAVSLTHIQNMPENTRGKLELDWHNLFLDMNRTLGRLLRRLPGNMTLSEALASVNAKPVAPDPGAARAEGKGAKPAAAAGA
ncbi:MAG TPA: hypothetical protein PLG73_08255 [Candidatus Sumerlaeota bacterium]|nr:hypothetical protein [Candidatus Sumerlaeota bacterium]